MILTYRKDGHEMTVKVSGTWKAMIFDRPLPHDRGRRGRRWAKRRGGAKR